jgi:transketolase
MREPWVCANSAASGIAECLRWLPKTRAWRSVSLPARTAVDKVRPSSSETAASRPAEILFMPPTQAIQRKAAELGKLAVQMTTAAGSGHPSSALSLAHLTTVLMYRQMRYDPANPWHPAGDRLVLSEGHAVPIVYAAYADLGGAVGQDSDSARKLRIADLDDLRARDSVLDGHPNPAEGFPFFDAATGSLGQGLSVAAGLGLAARLDGSGRRIYAIVGDGESREGQIWEAVDFIVERQLTDVCMIFNANGHGQAAAVSPQQLPDRLAAKLRAFGCEVVEIDGHDAGQIEAALARMGQAEQPLAIVARTVKGWGVDALLNGNWHGKPLKKEDLDAAYASLDKAADTDHPADLGPPPPPPPLPAQPVARPDPRSVDWPAFRDTMISGGLELALDKGKLATRQAYGATLKVAGDLLPHVVALDGDVSNSTFAEIFGAAHSERFFECKIAEQNMVSVAAGLAAAGYIPFVNSFAKFIARAYDQVELANISRANIKLVGSHAGVTPCSDGPSQMALADMAFFRAFAGVRGDDRENPLCWVYQPADAVAAYHCTRLMLAHQGMCYMRTHRPAVPLLYKPDTTFEPGGMHVLATGADIAIVTAGYLVHLGHTVRELLGRQNIHATLIDAYSFPINAEPLADALRRAGRRALVVEDNYAGGLGAAVAEIAARSGDLEVHTLCCERVPKSTRTEAEELEYCGVSPAQIADHALAMLRRPR